MERLASQPFIRAGRIVVKPDRLVCDIAISPDCPRVSSPALLDALRKRHPALPHHACKNSKGTTFGAVMEKTAIIHVLEHVAIDCMVQENPCSSTLFVGNSQWIDQKAGAGRVMLSYQDDISALEALKTALEQLNEALTQAVST